MIKISREDCCYNYRLFGNYEEHLLFRFKRLCFYKCEYTSPERVVFIKIVILNK